MACSVGVAAVPLMVLSMGRLLVLPDIISTLWGMWWLQQEGAGAVFGTEYPCQFPMEQLAVLSPTSALMWAGLEPVGVGGAQTISISIGLYGVCSVCKGIFQDRGTVLRVFGAMRTMSVL